MSARPMRLELYRSAESMVGHVQADGEEVWTFVNRWRWRIRATNGRILADSGEAYQRLRDCAHGAELVTGLPCAIDWRAGDDWFDICGDRQWRIVVDK